VINISSSKGWLSLTVTALIVTFLSCAPAVSPTSAPDPTPVAPGTESPHAAIRTPPPSLPPTTATASPATTTTLPFPSPDNSRLAVVQDLGTLIVQDADGQQHKILVIDEISSLAWFPNGDHIVYSDRDPSQPVVNREDTLWIISIPPLEADVCIRDVETGERHQIGTGHAPRVSPDGRYVAVLAGVLWGDACHVGYRLTVVELDATMRTAAVYHQTDFAGLPRDDEAASFYPTTAGDLTAPGRWRSNTELVTAMKWACPVQDNTEGIYLLDLTTRQARKIDGLSGD